MIEEDFNIDQLKALIAFKLAQINECYTEVAKLKRILWSKTND